MNDFITKDDDLDLKSPARMLSGKTYSLPDSTHFTKDLNDGNERSLSVIPTSWD